MPRPLHLAAQTRGILLMLAAIFLFTMMDATAKAIAQRSDTVMAIWARYLGQAVVVTLVALPNLRSVLRTRYPGFQVLRSVLLLGATTSFFFGFSLIGLAEATAIMDLNPVLITLGAALFLGERFGPRRAIAVAGAFIGALIIIRPGSAVFTPHALLPLVGACCYAGYALITRFIGHAEAAMTSLFYTAVFGAVAVSLAVPAFWTPPDGITILLMLVIGLFGSLGHFCLIRAFMAAEASVVAPFAYAGLVFAILWGMAVFGEYPDALTYLGALVIVAAGVYVWHRETRAKAGPAE